MATEVFQPTPVYLISGTGPYVITHPYQSADELLVLFRGEDGSEIVIDPSNYSVSPELNPKGSSGDLTLDVGWATTNDGAALVIGRRTDLEQGWKAVLGAREDGLEAQLDRMTQAAQDNEEKLGRAFTVPKGSSFSPQLPTLVDGETIIRDGDKLVAGPTADEITNAQGHAEEATASAAAAVTTQAAVAAELSRFIPTVSALKASTISAQGSGKTYSAGGHRYVEASSAATDHHLTTAAGVKLYLEPEANGLLNAKGLGAVADGVDNFGMVTHGYNALTGSKFYTMNLWTATTVYAVGDLITHQGGIPTTQPWVRYYAASTGHTAADFTAEVANWTEVFPWNWTTGISYTAGDIVFNQADDRGYVCITAHTSGASLAADSVNWEAGALTGTDNSAVMDLCITLLHEKGLAAYWPAGTYKFDTPDYATVAGGNAVHNFKECEAIFIQGEARQTKFLINETSDRLVTTVAQSFWLDGRQTTTDPVVRDEHSIISITGVEFHGRWSHAPGGSDDDPNGMGLCPFRFEGFGQEIIKDVGFYNIRNKGFRNSNNANVTHNDIHGKWCARGFIRSTNSSNVMSQGHRVAHGGDDSIDYNIDGGDSAVTSANILLSNYIVTDGESIQCSGGRNVRISNGITNRSKGSALQVPRAGGSSLGTGLGPKIGVSISDVLANDPLMFYDPDTGFAAQDIANAAFGLSGNKRVAVAGVTWPGDYDAVADAFFAPWEKDENSVAPSPMLNSRGDTEVQSHGMLNTIHNPAAIRNLPDVAAYSHWGFGPMFTRQGWHNPAVSSDNYNGSMLALLFDLSDTQISNPISFGLLCNVYFSAANSNRKKDAFRNILITNPNFKAVGDTPIYFDDPGEAVTWTVTIEGGVIDGDPYFKDAKRTSGPLDGTWSSTGTSSSNQKAIYCPANIMGLTVRGVSFRNVYTPYENGTGTDDNAQFFDNVQYCQPSVSGASDADNKGIRKPKPAGPGWKYVYEDSDPQSGAYGTILNYCLEFSDGKPTSGWYPKGHFVQNTSPSLSSGKVLLGWIRLIDGLGQVLDTDWAEVYATNT